MHRRTWVILASFLVMIGISPLTQKPGPKAHPTAQQRAWQDLGLGMFIHFAPNTWQDREYDDLSTPLSAIDPKDLDTDQWVETAVAMGARYIIFVAKHVGGFCMWPTRTTDYSIEHTPWRDGKGDVMGDLAASCLRKGIKLGIYLSPKDAKHGADIGGRCRTEAEQQAYNRLYRDQLSELLTGYGPIVEVWFDGSLAVPVADILKEHAPQAMVFQGPQATIRWVGNEMGFAPYPAWNAVSSPDARTGIATALHGDPCGDVWMPNEVDVSLRRPNWFWSTSNQDRLMSLEDLLEIYYRSVGRGANLLLNLTPDRSGLIPTADAARAREFGDEVRRRFERSAAETSGAGSVLELRLETPTKLDHAILQEDTSRGERVRRYRLEGLTEKGWVSLGQGTAIGQMRIQPFGLLTLEAIRLVCSQSQGTPHIRRLAVFGTGCQPPETWNDPARVWADDEAGRWQNGQIELDLTDRIDSAGQYRLRFVADGGAGAAISQAEFLLDGISRRHLLRPERGRTDVLILTVPGPGQYLRLSARIQGAASGTVLLQKL